MKYIKNNKIKPGNEIVLYIDGKQILNPSKELLLENGWEEYIPPKVTEKEILQRSIKQVLRKISAYDSSNHVNGFYIGNVHMWLDKATRVGLMLRFQSEKTIGSNTTSLWYDDVKYELNLDDAMNMLTALEIYASACYDNTQYHIAEVKKITNLEDLKNYDYTVGYPEKLKF